MNNNELMFFILFLSYEDARQKADDFLSEPASFAREALLALSED